MFQFASHYVSRLSAHDTVRQLFNAGLRLASLGSKLLLTLFMGRFLGLTEMGSYGLVAAYVAIAIPLLGMRLDYVVARELVDAGPMPLACKMRDQLVLYGVNYAVFVMAVLLLSLCWPEIFDPAMAKYAVILSVAESLGAATSANFVPLKKPITSTLLFFIRSALWVFPVMLGAWLYPQLRVAQFVFILWLLGVVMSLLVTAWLWRGLPWRDVLAKPVDWSWIRRSIMVCLPIWLGAVAAAAAGNLDRFVVEAEIGRDYVGIISFYGSFVTAMLALLQNGVVSFSYPRLVTYFREQDHDAFRAEAVRMSAQCAASVAVMAVIIGIVVPMLGRWFGRPEFSDYAAVLWLMLLGAWLKAAAEGLYYVMYARHQDRAIWMGNFSVLLVSALATVLSVKLSGFWGIGYAAVVTGIFIVIWRSYWIWQYTPPSREKQA